MDLALGFLFCSIDLYFCLCASTILYWLLWLCSIVWSQAGWFLQFYSSFSRLLWLFEVFFFFLYFHTNCEIICYSSVKNTIGSLMLERVWRKGNPLTLLVGMQTSTANMENSVEIPLKTWNRTAIWPGNPTPRHTHWGNGIWKRHRYPSVHCSTVYSSQDMEAT